MKFLSLLLVCFASFSAPAQNRVEVRISNIENNRGICLICLYDNPRAFSGKGQPVRTLRVTPQSGAATAVFEGLAAGTYAILVIHDANNNNKFDTNFLGIPSEGYGASNNKLPFAAAPRFSENQITVTGNSTTASHIKLRYIL